MQIDITKIVLALAVASALVFVVVKACDSEVDKINRRMDKLCDLASMSGQESNLAAGMRATEITKYFMPNIRIQAQEAPISISSRSELRRLIFRARTQLSRIEVKARKKETTLGEDGETAKMAVSMYISAKGPQGGEDFREAFDIEWTRDDGEWKIRRIDRRETIQLIQ